MLSLMEILRSYHFPVQGKVLAQKLNISLRTLYRDIATLQTQGVSIEGEAGIGYVLRPGFVLPPLMLTQNEIEALALGASWVVKRADPQLKASANSAINKIAAVIPTELKQYLETNSLLIGPAATTVQTAVDIPQIRQAISHRHKITFTYLDLKSNQSMRVIWPFDLRKKWEIDLEYFEFEGEVKTGQYGRMVLSGMPEIRFYLANIEINKEFTDQVNLPQMGRLTFCHQILTDESNMANCIKVSVSFEPEDNISNAQAVSFFKQVTQDLVETLSRLKDVIEKMDLIEKTDVIKENNAEKSAAVKPNLQLIYSSDIERSMAFYTTIFNTEPIFSSPHYVAFNAGKEAIFAIWSGGTKPDNTVPRFSEIGIMLPSGEAVDQLFEKWQENPNIEIQQEPYTDVFGRTFLVKVPDGHMIRVCPLD
nr:HTH domain-containing protein [Xenorhabdus japonica]